MPKDANAEIKQVQECDLVKEQAICYVDEEAPACEGSIQKPHTSVCRANIEELASIQPIQEPSFPTGIIDLESILEWEHTQKVAKSPIPVTPTYDWVELNGVTEGYIEGNFGGGVVMRALQPPDMEPAEIW